MHVETDVHLDSIRGAAHPITGAPQDYNTLMQRIGNAPFVLIGEASHGTHEFYHQRAEITKRLIQEKAFTADSLCSSIAAVLRYLEKVDPQEALRARRRYACFEHFGADVQQYGYAAEYGIAASCEDQVVEQLVELRRRAAEYAERDGRVAAGEFFFAEQNARLVKDAEQYYRSMFRGRQSSWNLRDRHMSDTLDALDVHLKQQYSQSRIVVWAHNSHLGDARATELGDAGELNPGQLSRERYGRDALLIGFLTHRGTVTAASDWDGPAERKRVRPALPDSYEALFHAAGIPSYMLVLHGREPSLISLPRSALQRAIGVVYRPQTERHSHYFNARLADQFDVLIHFDVTRAVEPLERTPGWETGEWETFPSGI